jgi:glycosyltransferase involved in cell wall biosynthesis
MNTLSICWIGGARYPQPLDPTSAKKFAALQPLGRLYVVGFATGIGPRRFRQHAEFFLLPNLPAAPLRYLTLTLLGALVVFWLVLRRNVGVLVAQSPYEAFAAALVKRLAALFGRSLRLVIESHGDFEQALFIQRRVRLPGLYRALMRHAARSAFAQADALRAISSATRQQLAAWAPKVPIEQFPTWTDIGAFLNAHPPAHSPEIVYAGVLTPLKGVHVLLDAFAAIAAAHPGVRLVLVGAPVDASYAAALHQQVERSGLADRVLFLGHLTQTELATRVAGACVFVLPSFSEGLGRVVFEAMACGVPVVASDVGGIPDIVEAGVNGWLVPPGDAAALAERLGWMLSHPEEAACMGRRAKASVAAIFSTDHYVASYRALLGSPRAVIQEPM